MYLLLIGGFLGVDEKWNLVFYFYLGIFDSM